METSESTSRLGQWWASTLESLNEQQWFQELRGKWEELDAQSQLYVKAGSLGFLMLLLLLWVGSFIYSVYSYKSQVREKTELLSLLQSSNDELKRLRMGAALPAGESPNDTAPWPAFFEGIGSQAGVDKANLTVSAEKSVTPAAPTGAASKDAPPELAKESLFELSLKKVSVRQVIRMAFSIENSPRPVRLRNLTIDTQADPEGYMNATLHVSAFTPVAGK